MLTSPQMKTILKSIEMKIIIIFYFYNETLHSNLLKPPGIMLRTATLIMKLYKAEDLPRSKILKLKNILF